MPATVVRDPVHGMVELSADEWRAVDAPVFQRLRSVRQLAMTHLVYPGAVHTRFEHSVGVLHIAGRLAVRPSLEIPRDDLPVIRAAALLHDVGHGVFSHVSEQVIEEISGVENVHEAVSAHIMRNDRQIRQALGAEICERAADIVALKGPRSVERDIVSGPTDADKLDYLLRDSYFAGVNYGRYDLGRIIESARVIAPRSAQTQLGFDAGGLWAVEGMLLARHHMHRQVYGHKTRLATDIMLTRALRLAVENGVLPERAYRVDSTSGRPDITDDFVSAYVTQTDVLVLDALRRADVAPVADLAARLVDRRLLRQTVALRLDDQETQIGDAQLAAVLDPEEFTAEAIVEVEAHVAAELGLQAHLVAVYVDSRKNPTYRNPGRAVGPKDIMLQRSSGPPRVLHKESEIFVNEQGSDDPWIYLYTEPLGTADRDRQAEELLCSCLRDL